MNTLRRFCGFRIAYSWTIIVVISLIIVNGFASLIANLHMLISENVYHKDFIQDYLMVMAIVNGDNPYLTIGRLAQVYLRDLPPSVNTLNHPTPHPPSMGLLLLPLGSLDYRNAAAAWFGVGVASLAGTVLLLTRGDGISLPWWKIVLIVIGLVGWTPVRRELLLGQPMVLITFLVVIARVALFSGRPMLAGASIAGALLLKPVPWMVLLVLLLRGQFGVLGAALVTLFIGALATVAAVGSETLFAYLTEMLPAVSTVYLASGLNISVPAVAWRILHGTDSYAQDSFFTRPLIMNSKSLAIIASLFLQMCIMTVLVHLVRIAKTTDQAISLGICLSIMINPIAWGTYLVLTLIPLWQVVHSLWHQGFPARETCLAALVLILLSIPITYWLVIAQVLAGVRPIEGTPIELPAFPSFLTFAPDVALAVLGWLVLKCSPPAVIREPTQDATSRG